MTKHEAQMEKYRAAGREVLIDFDGTIAEFSYPELGPPRAGAREFIEWLIKRDLRPVIWSSRMSRAHNSDLKACDEVGQISYWLERHGFPSCEVDSGRVGKRLALAYVDDRGVACDDSTPWDVVRARVEQIHARETARWAKYDKEKS